MARCAARTSNAYVRISTAVSSLRSTTAGASSTRGGSTSPSKKTRCCQWWGATPFEKKRVREARSSGWRA
eukprot:6056486-Pleurochrysis_carterae.AAC.1